MPLLRIEDRVLDVGRNLVRALRDLVSAINRSRPTAVVGDTVAEYVQPLTGYFHEDTQGPVTNVDVRYLVTCKENGDVVPVVCDKYGRVITGTAAGMWTRIEIQPNLGDQILLAKSNLSELCVGKFDEQAQAAWPPKYWDYWALVNAPRSAQSVYGGP